MGSGSKKPKFGTENPSCNKLFAILSSMFFTFYILIIAVFRMTDDNKHILRTPAMFAHESSISRLNDDCLIEIFNYLPPEDRILMEQGRYINIFLNHVCH